MEPINVVGVGFGLFFVLMGVGAACVWWFTRASTRARQEARQLREENLDTMIQWFFTRAVDVGRNVRGVRGGVRGVSGNRVTHVRSPIPVMSRDRDVTNIPMLAWEQA